MQSLIVEPALKWAAGQATVLSITPLTLPVGRSVTDFSTFTLTIRQDPLWPRTGDALANRPTADPIAQSWPVVLTAAGTLVSSVPTFEFTVPSGAGIERYSLDVWGTLSAGGEVQLVRATWLTVNGRVK